MKTLRRFIKSNWVIVVFSIIGPILGFIVGASYLNFHPDTPDTSVAYGLGFMVAMIFHVGATSAIINDKHEKFSKQQKLSTKNALQEVKREIAEQSTEFKSWYSAMQDGRFKIREIDQEQADQEILNAVVSADTVFNTYVNLSQTRGTKSNSSAGILDLYSTHLSNNKGNIWQDIVGVSDFLDGRFHDISINTGDCGSHRLIIISDSLPIINFLLIGKKGDFQVFFGWLESDLKGSSVFHSKDSRVVEMFQQNFRLLSSYKKDSIDVDYGRSSHHRFRSLTVESIRGVWVTVSMSSSTKDSKNYATFSVIMVGSKNGNWVVEGRSFERKSKKPIHVIRGYSASVLDGGIVYKFERTDSDGGSLKRGHGVIDLTAGSSEVAVGHYAVEDDKRKPLHKIKGLRISGNPDMAFEEFPWQSLDSYIDRIHRSIV